MYGDTWRFLVFRRTQMYGPVVHRPRCLRKECVLSKISFLKKPSGSIFVKLRAQELR